MKKTILLLLSAFLIMLSSAQEQPRTSPINPEYINYLELKKKGKWKKYTKQGHPLGEIPVTNKPDFTKFQKTEVKTLPSSYDLRSVNSGAWLTSVKNQGNAGTCWTFATYGAIESYLLKFGHGEYDFSEQNLVTCHGFDWGWNDGGNYQVSTAYLTRFSGAISENDDPYTLPDNTSCTSGLTPTGYIKEAVFLPGVDDNSYDPAIIKQAILDHGAIYVNMNYHGDYMSFTDYTYYYSQTGNGTNHAVLLVGWDDNKTVTGGIATPNNPGAWIIRNSWGSSWGENGFFYISYEDTEIISSAAYFSTFEPYSYNSKAYYIDDFGATSGYGWSDGTDYGLIKYTASQDITVNSIGTYVRASGSNIDIEIYDNFDGNTTSNLLASIPSQNCNLPGFYSFDLSAPITISAGNDYYIKVMYQGGDYPIPVESQIAGYTGGATIETERCWVSSSGSGGTWYALGAGGSAEYDLCIKAYVSLLGSNNAPTVTNPISDITQNEGFGSTTVDLSNVFTDADGDVLSYTASNDNTGVVTVSISGTTLTITETGTGTANITVTADDGNGGTVSDVFTITVGQEVDLTMNVNMNYQISLGNFDPASSNLDVAGTFNDWSGTPMTDPDGDNIFSVTIPNQVVGEAIEFKFRMNGTWDGTEEFPDGGPNRTYTIQSSGNNPVYWYNDEEGTTSNSYCEASSNSSVAEYISNVNINSGAIDNTSEASFYSDFTSLSTDMNTGQSYSLSVEISNSWSSDEVLVWIDWNQDADFEDSGENIPLSYTPIGDGSSSFIATATITPPSDAALGQTGFRIRLHDANIDPNSTPCGASAYGEVEDYTINIVEGTNNVPTVANPISDITQNEGFGSTTVYLSNVFADADGDVLNYSVSNDNTGVVTVSISGTTLTITETGIGSANITVTADDGNGGTVSDVFSVTVNSSTNNVPTVANPISDITQNEGFGSTTVYLSNVFADADGDVLNYSVSNDNTGVVTVSISGTTLTITETGIGSANITVTADDGNGGTVSDVFSVTVNSSTNNVPTVANPISDITQNEGFGSTTVYLSNVFADADGDVLNYSVSNDNTGVVTVSISGTTLTITETGIGSANITVTADDGNGGTVSDVFSVTVNSSTNNVPTVANPISDITQNENFGSTTVYLSNVFTDADGDVLNYSVSNDNTGVVTVSISGTTLTITETGIGSANITVTADDGNGGTVSDVFSVTVNSSTNNVPTVANPISDITQNENFGSTTVYLSNVFADADGDVLNYSVSNDNTGVVTVSISGTTLTITETGIGSANITVTADDGNGGTVSDVFSVTVNSSTNNAPTVANPISDITQNEGFGSTTVYLSNVFTDADGDVLNYSVSNDNTGVVTVSISGTTLTITETGIGSANITVTADDGNGGTVSDVFSVTVNSSTNNAPTVANPISDITQNEGFGSTTVYLSNVFTDADGDVLNYSVSNDNTGVVTVSISGTTLTITETGIGSANITVTADDGNGGTVSDVFSVTVNSSTNNAPTVANPISDITQNEGFGSTTVYLSNVFTDADGDVLNYSVSNDNTGVVTVSISGTTLTITETGIGSANITVTADDGNGGTVSDVFLVTVNSSTNNAPTVANPISDITQNEGFGSTTVYLSNVFADADGDVLNYSVSNDNTGVVTVSISGTTLTITETGIGSANITVTADDGNGGTVSDVFSVTVNAATGLTIIAEKGILIYPNPTDGMLTLSFDKFENFETVTLELTDIAGKQILKEQVTSKEQQLNISDLESGVYILNIIIVEEIITTKIMKK